MWKIGSEFAGDVETIEKILSEDAVDAEFEIFMLYRRKYLLFF
jgi:hypothetical protein